MPCNHAKKGQVLGEKKADSKRKGSMAFTLQASCCALHQWHHSVRAIYHFHLLFAQCNCDQMLN